MRNAAKSKERRVSQIVAQDLPDEPKTPHEEVMFVVESNNEMLSELMKNAEAAKERRKNATFIFDNFIKWVKQKEQERNDSL